MAEPDAALDMPVRCPAISRPEFGLADPADFDALLERLADPRPVTEVEQFSRGLVHPDGRVDLCKQGIGPVEVQRVAQTAVRSPHAAHLLLGTNGLGAAGAAAVAEVLTPGHRIRTVYLGCNRIDADGVAALADRVATDRTVRALWLKRNPLGDAGLARLSLALKENSAVRTLDLDNTGIALPGLEALADALAERPVKLERLFLGGNGLRPDAVPALIRIVRDGGVRELYLAANQLCDDGTAALAAAAAPYPMTFGLGGNNIGPNGARVLAANMHQWRALDLARRLSERPLGAVSNVVGDDGAAAFAAALPGSRLRRLDLRRSGITGRGAKLLLAAVKTGTDLTYLGLLGDVPRRIRRAVSAACGPVDPPHEDIGAIVSTYR